MYTMATTTTPKSEKHNPQATAIASCTWLNSFRMAISRCAMQNVEPINH